VRDEEEGAGLAHPSFAVSVVWRSWGGLRLIARYRQSLAVQISRVSTVSIPRREPRAAEAESANLSAALTGACRARVGRPSMRLTDLGMCQRVLCTVGGERERERENVCVCVYACLCPIVAAISAR
jgi:hypothetical protein